MTEKKPIGQMLIEAGLINQEELDGALEEQKVSGQKIGSILIMKELISIDDFNKVLQQHTGFEAINLRNHTIPPGVIAILNTDICKKHKLIPVLKDNYSLTVAMSDPSDQHSIDDMEFISGLKVKALVAPEITIQEAMKKYLNPAPEEEVSLHLEEDEMVEDPILESIEEPEEETSMESSKSNESPVVKLVNRVIWEAIKKGASHIHFEPHDKTFKIKLRIDGALHEFMEPPINMRGAIVSRLKIISGIDISESRIPQDSRIMFNVKMGGSIKPVTLKVITLPTSHGERIVLHIQDREKEMRELDQLGLLPLDLDILEKCLNSRSGVILVTGPRDSGKTTTIYSILNYLKKRYLSIVTAENPVENSIDGINQSLIKPEIGLSYTSLLKNMKQQDADVLMIQEIPDQEVAQTIARASLDGYLILSSMYAPDSISVLIKLMDLRLNPYAILSSIRLILAQQLVRAVCQKCRYEYAPTKNQLNFITPMLILNANQKKMKSDSIRLFKGKGCDACGGSGYRGRFLVNEILEPSEKMDDIQSQDFSKANIKNIIKKSGIHTLAHRALNLALEGKTTFEEFFRIFHDTQGK